jgi:hypothetical protein
VLVTLGGLSGTLGALAISFGVTLVGIGVLDRVLRLGLAAGLVRVFPPAARLLGSPPPDDDDASTLDRPAEGR